MESKSISVDIDKYALKDDLAALLKVELMKKLERELNDLEQFKRKNAHLFSTPKQ